MASSPSDDVLLEACQTLGRAIFRAGSSSIAKLPNGLWRAEFYAAAYNGALEVAWSTGRTAAIHALYCRLWARCDDRVEGTVDPARFSDIREAMAATEGLFGLPEEPSKST